MTIITTQLFPQQQFFDTLAHPLEQGWVHSYTNGIPLSLYSDRNGLTALPNPFQLDSAGKIPLGIRGIGTYEITINDRTDTSTYYSFSGVQLGYGATQEASLVNLTVTSNTWSTTTGNDIIWLTATTGTYQIKGTSLSSGSIYFYENTANGTNYIGLYAPSSIASNRTWTLDDSDIITFPAQISRHNSGTYLKYRNTTSSSAVADTIYTTADAYLLLSRDFTPKSATSVLKIEVNICFTSTSTFGLGTYDRLRKAIFLMISSSSSSIAGVLKGRLTTSSFDEGCQPFKIVHYMTSGTTSSVTFSVYGKGFNAGTADNYFEMAGNKNLGLLGGVMANTIFVTEYPA